MNVVERKYVKQMVIGAIPPGLVKGFGLRSQCTCIQNNAFLEQVSVAISHGEVWKLTGRLVVPDV